MGRRPIHDDAACPKHMLGSSYRQWAEDFVAAHRGPILSWTSEARAMLPACPAGMSGRDLAMLAAMIERGGLAMLPVSAFSDFVMQSLERIETDLPRPVLEDDALRDVLLQIVPEEAGSATFEAIHGMIASLILPARSMNRFGGRGQGRLAA